MKKYCINCKHLDHRRVGPQKCNHPKIAEHYDDAVYGKGFLPADCWKARRLFGKCGRKGKYFESKDDV